MRPLAWSGVQYRMSNAVCGRGVFAAIVLSVAILAGYNSFVARDTLVLANGGDGREGLPAKYAGADAVTSDIRSAAKVFTRVEVRSKEDRAKAAQAGRIVEDYGTFVIIAKNAGVAAKSFDLQEQLVETSVHLPGATFDPVKMPPSGSLRLGEGAVSNGRGYYVIQFGANVTDEWLKSIREAGVEVLQYVPHQAFLVYADDEAIAKAANHSRVRWIGSYTAEQKLSAVFKQQIGAARTGTALVRGISGIEKTGSDTAVFDIGIFARAGVDTFANDIRATFAKGLLRPSRLPNNYFNLVRAELRLADIEAVAALPDVISIEPVIKTRNEDERSAQIVAGNYLNPTTILGSGYDPLTQFGVDGTNVTVSVVDDGVGIPGDGGFYLSSLNAANGPLRGATTGAFGHGHLNATIIAGSTPFGPLDPLFYNYGRGVAPRANIVNIPRNRLGYTGTDAEVYNDSVTTAGPNGAHALISNNSWGSGTNGNAYSLFAAQFDGFVRDASADVGIDPIVLVFSGGNDGVAGLTQPKTAKNIIAVGNSESVRSELGGTSANNMDDLAADSSLGPTADGRIKPDVVAPGTAITGGRSGVNTLNGNIDSAHRWSSGSSHSAAHITGVAALFANWWYATNFGLRPSPALIRAAIINSARDVNGGGTATPAPNGSEGWGRPNMKNMLNTGVGMRHFNDDLVGLAAPGQGLSVAGSVADASKPVKVTLAWTDPPGVTDPALVNNLDLRVTIGGTVYRGNVFSNGVSVAGGAGDNRNNVEVVYLPAGIPAGTAFDIEVTAVSLNGDGILNNGDDTDQAFSLVIYNYSAQVPSASYTLAGRVVSQSGRGIGMAKVRLTNNQGVSRETLTNTSGYFTFSSVAGNQNYTINVTAKRHTFNPTNQQVNGNMTNLSITSISGSP